MNRPKHKKNKNPLLPDDQQVDERNLIDAEESVELSIEDKISIYWMENKGFIITCFIVLAGIIVGINGVKMYGESAKAKLQDAYSEAKANDTLDAFAKENTGRELGGFAALTVADEAYNAEDFTKAAEFYALAESALGENILAGRAAIGAAFAAFNNGSEADGVAKLNQIAADASFADAVRSEAVYHLAVDAYTSGNTDAFDSFVAQLATTDKAGQWQNRIDYYIRQGQ